MNKYQAAGVALFFWITDIILLVGLKLEPLSMALSLLIMFIAYCLVMWEDKHATK